MMQSHETSQAPKRKEIHSFIHSFLRRGWAVWTRCRSLAAVHAPLSISSADALALFEDMVTHAWATVLSFPFICNRALWDRPYTMTHMCFLLWSVVDMSIGHLICRHISLQCSMSSMIRWRERSLVTLRACTGWQMVQWLKGKSHDSKDINHPLCQWVGSEILLWASFSNLDLEQLVHTEQVDTVATFSKSLATSWVWSFNFTTSHAFRLSGCL